MRRTQVAVAGVVAAVDVANEIDKSSMESTAAVVAADMAVAAAGVTLAVRS